MLTRDVFRRLSPRQQLLHLFTVVAFLARRQEEDGGMNLYHCPNAGRGFFVEVSYEEHTQSATLLRCFDHSGPLEDYIHGLPLPADK